MVILEIANGASDAFHSFYLPASRTWKILLPELGFDSHGRHLPVTSDRESFGWSDRGLAEVISDSAQYLIVHTPTGKLLR